MVTGKAIKHEEPIGGDTLQDIDLGARYPPPNFSSWRP